MVRPGGVFYLTFFCLGKLNIKEDGVKRLSPSQTISLLREAHMTETCLRKVKSALIKVNKGRTTQNMFLF